MKRPNAITTCLLTILTLALAAATSPAAAQMPAKMKTKHIQTETGAIATGVWAGSTYYLSGQLRRQDGDTGSKYGQHRAASPRAARGRRSRTCVAEQGLAMKDVVMMHVYLAGDPATDGKLDFDGMMVRLPRVLRHQGTAQQARPQRDASRRAGRSLGLGGN